MMNVVINDKDLFFRFGLLKLLQQIFSLAETDFIVSDKLDATTVHDVDVIVMNFSVGETVICHQVLKKRKKKSLLIGIYPEKKNPRFARLPLCVKNSVFIARDDSIKAITDKIHFVAKSLTVSREGEYAFSCLDCACRVLSLQQMKIAVGFFHGQDTKQIAKVLSINAKTVSAHKRQIMQKYDLDCDFELLTLLNRMGHQQNMRYLFSERLIFIV